MIEEYTAGMDGGRQDSIVNERPAGNGALPVDLAVEGAKSEQASGGGRLVQAWAGRALAYRRLRAVDTHGRELKARMAVVTSARLTDLPLFPSKPSAVVCLRKPLYARPFRGLVSRRLLGFLRDNMGGFSFGSTSKISDCARG